MVITLQKIMYFTAGMIPTNTEANEIAAIEALCVTPYEVVVRRGDAVGTRNYGAGPEATDFVAGTVPPPYDNDDEEEGTVYPVFDPDDPPAPVLPANQAVVSNNQVVGAYKITVVDNVVTAIAPV